jgi:polyhydroxybutyrate depolymerase
MQSLRWAMVFLFMLGMALPACQPAAQTTNQWPRTPGITVQGLEVDGVHRTLLLHTPPGLQPGASAVLVFHGAGGSGAGIRSMLGPAMEEAARKRGFIVAYPDGIGGDWTDCRSTVPHPAGNRTRNDPAFVEALIRWLESHHDVNPRQVRIVGYSTGAHLVFRLALERPDLVQAAAVIGAGLPVDSDSRCRPAGDAVPVLVMNGTADPFNPYAGGMARGPRGRPLGEVLGALETAERLAARAGHAQAPRRIPVLRSDASTGLPVERLAWVAPGLPEVSLYTVHGGGHTIPGAESGFTGPLGHSEFRLSAVEEIVRFFHRQPG